MDAGNAAEFDEPFTLLQNENGIFHGMVKALGDQQFDSLSQTAWEQYKSINDNSAEVTSL